MNLRGLLLLVVAGMALGCGKPGSKEERADAGVQAAGSGGEGEREGGGERGGEHKGGDKSKGEGEAEGETTSRVGVRKLSLDAEEVAAIFSKLPRLQELVEELRLFGEPYDVNVVKRRGSQDVGDWIFSANPVLWTPAGGEPHLVVTGRSKKDSFIVALERLPSGDYQLASSIIFRNDAGPFVLAYQANARERLQWTSCWKCKGEGGAIVAKDSGKRVVVIQQ